MCAYLCLYINVAYGNKCRKVKLHHTVYGMVILACSAAFWLVASNCACIAGSECHGQATSALQGIWEEEESEKEGSKGLVSFFLFLLLPFLLDEYNEKLSNIQLLECITIDVCDSTPM